MSDFFYCDTTQKIAVGKGNEKGWNNMKAFIWNRLIGECKTFKYFLCGFGLDEIALMPWTVSCVILLKRGKFTTLQMIGAFRCKNLWQYGNKKMYMHIFC